MKKADSLPAKVKPAVLSVSKTEQRRNLIKNTYETIFTALKPNDIAVMGVFQKNHDQLTKNVEVFNKWAQTK